MAARNLYFVTVMRIVLLCGADHDHRCGEKLTKVRGSIHYPASQGTRYQNNRKCSWIIDLGIDYKIHLTFTKFDLEKTCNCEFDHLKITYGIGQRRRETKTYCGKTLPNDIISNTGRVKLLFQSGKKNVGRGFELNYMGFKDSVTLDTSYSTFKTKESTTGMSIDRGKSTTIYRYQETTYLSTTFAQEAHTRLQKEENQKGVTVAICTGVVVILLMALVIVFYRQSRKSHIRENSWEHAECFELQRSDSTTTKNKSTNTMGNVFRLTKGDETQQEPIYELAEPMKELYFTSTKPNSLSDDLSMRQELARRKAHCITSHNDGVYDHASAPPNGDDEYHRLDTRNPKQQYKVDDTYDRVGDVNVVDNYSVLRRTDKY